MAYHRPRPAEFVVASQDSRHTARGGRGDKSRTALFVAKSDISAVATAPAAIYLAISVPDRVCSFVKMVFRQLAFYAEKRGFTRFHTKACDENPPVAAFLDDVYFHAAPPPPPVLCRMPHYEVFGHLACSGNSESHRE